jgi:hypothetical protein
METVISTDGTRIAFDRHVGGDVGTEVLEPGWRWSRSREAHHPH